MRCKYMLFIPARCIATVRIQPERTEENIFNVSWHSSFSQTYKTGNIGIYVNCVFLFICRFLSYLHHMMSVNVKLDVSGYYIL